MANIPSVPSLGGSYLRQVAENRQRDKERGSMIGRIFEGAMTQGLGRGLGALGEGYAKSLFEDDELDWLTKESNKPNADIEVFTEPDPETSSQGGLQRRLDELLADSPAGTVGTGRGQALGEEMRGGRFTDYGQGMEGAVSSTRLRSEAPDEVEGPGRMTTMNRAILAMQKKAGTKKGQKELHQQLYPAVVDPRNPTRAPQGRRFTSAKAKHLWQKNVALTRRAEQKEIQDMLTSEKGREAHNLNVEQEREDNNAKATARTGRGAPTHSLEGLVWMVGTKWFASLVYERGPDGKWVPKMENGVETPSFPNGKKVSKETMDLLTSVYIKTPEAKQKLGIFLRTGLDSNLKAQLPGNVLRSMKEAMKKAGPETVLLGGTPPARVDLVEAVGPFTVSKGVHTYVKAEGAKSATARSSERKHHLTIENLVDLVDDHSKGTAAKGLRWDRNKKKWFDVSVSFTDSEVDDIKTVVKKWDAMKRAVDVGKNKDANKLSKEIRKHWRGRRALRNKLIEVIQYNNTTKKDAPPPPTPPVTAAATEEKRVETQVGAQSRLSDTAWVSEILKGVPTRITEGASTNFAGESGIPWTPPGGSPRHIPLKALLGKTKVRGGNVTAKFNLTFKNQLNQDGVLKVSVALAKLVAAERHNQKQAWAKHLNKTRSTEKKVKIEKPVQESVLKDIRAFLEGQGITYGTKLKGWASPPPPTTMRTPAPGQGDDPVRRLSQGNQALHARLMDMAKRGEISWQSAKRRFLGQADRA